MASKTITDAQEFTKIINSGRVVMIDFYANWSGYSQLSGQQLLEFSETFRRLGVDLYRVNVDDADDVLIEADVRVVPTFMVFKDGKKVGYTEGIGGGNLYKLMGSHVSDWTGRKTVASDEIGTPA